MNIILPLVTFSNRWEEAILCLYVSSQMSCSLIILSTSISSSAQNQGNYTENCGCQDEQNSWFWWEVNAQPVSTAMPQPCFLRFDSFWSSPMCSIYLRKLKIHKNVIYLKSLKVGFSSTWTKNFQIYKMGFKEADRGPGRAIRRHPFPGALGDSLPPGPGPAPVIGALRLPGRPAESGPGLRRHPPPPRPLPHQACWRGQFRPQGSVGCPPKHRSIL